MSRLEFDPSKPKRNRVLLDELIKDIDYGSVEALFVDDEKRLFLLVDETNETDIKFYQYLSENFVNGDSSFIITPEMKEEAYKFFGQIAFESSKNRQLDAFRSDREIEIILV